ncbi:MAG: hypothetical protein JXQ90_23760 [Cyclobacteriaceae bacterium]
MRRAPVTTCYRLIVDSISAFKDLVNTSNIGEVTSASFRPEVGTIGRISLFLLSRFDEYVAHLKSQLR